MWEDWEKEELDEDGLVEFKGSAKAFVRTYAFLSCVLPYTNAAWEKLSIFLNFLIPKLPAANTRRFTTCAQQFPFPDCPHWICIDVFTIVI